MRSSIVALMLGVASLVPSHAGAQNRTGMPAAPRSSPMLVDERGEFRAERYEERCEQLRHDIRRDERAARGERVEGDFREAHEIHEHVEHLRREYAEHCERR